jgi:hypothetical protein
MYVYTIYMYVYNMYVCKNYMKYRGKWSRAHFI